MHSKHNPPNIQSAPSDPNSKRQPTRIRPDPH